MEPDPRRGRVFALTWIAYASYYLGRKGFAVSKARLERDYGIGATALGDIDTGFLAAYCAGQFLAGAAGDRLGSRRLVGFGMLAAAAACAAFGLGAGSVAFALAFTLNGLAQATGWPGTVKAMGAWFGGRERGTVMGAWSTCYQVGGLAATAAATFLLTHHGWRSAFLGPAVWIAAIGILILVALPEAPAATLAPTPAATATATAADRARLLRSPVLWSLGAAYFSLKLIRYSLLFWLPYYLRTTGYSESAAGYQSIAFELGGILGAIAVGLASDRLFRGRRRGLAAAMILALAGALYLYTQVAPLGPLANFAGLALVGFCLFGPDALISGAAAQDLGGPGGAALAAGVINGIGSLGAVVQGRVTTSVSRAFGWDAVFLLFVALALVASGALALIARREPPHAPASTAEAASS